MAPGGTGAFATGAAAGAGAGAAGADVVEGFEAG